ncbi:MAG: hypothetical protein ACLT1J_10505 [Mediterraneibacter gnavus]
MANIMMICNGNGSYVSQGGAINRILEVECGEKENLSGSAEDSGNSKTELRTCGQEVRGNHQRNGRR